MNFPVRSTSSAAAKPRSMNSFNMRAQRFGHKTRKRLAVSQQEFGINAQLRIDSK
jgi:hypothetical protein